VSLEHTGSLHAEHIEDGGDDVDGVVVLLPDLSARLPSGRPGHDARIARATVELVALPHLNGVLNAIAQPFR
jgi:hypothetical protein